MLSRQELAERAASRSATRVGAGVSGCLLARAHLIDSSE
jgi:hypothetical protein